uniref:Protein quiver n=1 Tax=Panagrellus redivivus TaxID=6233 RepID=A0A7E4V9T7_PANRE
MRLPCLTKTYHSSVLFILVFCDFYLPSNGRASSRNKHPLEPEVPSTRLKGEIGCFSCFSDNNARSKSNIQEPERRSASNLTDIVNAFQVSGMKVPDFAHRCADTLAHANPNFLGANVHICPNSPEEPGACVKFKGTVHGESYVYRECWSNMWTDPRPFRHAMSGGCYSDQFVQNSFVGFNHSTICFCEDDLCNVASTRALSLSSALIMCIIYYIFRH